MASCEEYRGLDRDESWKNSRAREKNFPTRNSRPEICARTDVGVEVSANETRCLCSMPAVDARRFTSRLQWPPATLLVSDYPSRPRPVSVRQPAYAGDGQITSANVLPIVEYTLPAALRCCYHFEWIINSQTKADIDNGNFWRRYRIQDSWHKFYTAAQTIFFITLFTLWSRRIFRHSKVSQNI